MARLKLLEGATWQYAGLGPKGPTGATGPNGSIGVTGSTVEQLKTRAYDLLAMKQRIDTEFKTLSRKY